MSDSLKILFIHSFLVTIVHGQMFFIGDDDTTIPNIVYAREDAILQVPISVSNLYQLGNIDGNALSIQLIYNCCDVNEDFFVDPIIKIDNVWLNFEIVPTSFQLIYNNCNWDSGTCMDSNNLINIEIYPLDDGYILPDEGIIAYLNVEVVGLQGNSSDISFTMVNLDDGDYLNFADDGIIAIWGDWLLTITAQDVDGIGSADKIYLGIREDAHDGWHYGSEEIPDINNPPDGGYTDIYFIHEDWIGDVDDNGVECCLDAPPHFLFDYRSIPSYRQVIGWEISGTTGGNLNTDLPIQLNWETETIDSLASEYNLYIFVDGNGYDMRDTSNIIISQDQLELANIWIYMGACANFGDLDYGDSCFDCEGIPNGTKVIDNCDLCVQLENVCTQDCNGQWGGTATEDMCGICNNPSDDCIQDCNGQWGGGAAVDLCGVCAGGTTDFLANAGIDCHGNCESCESDGTCVDSSTWMGACDNCIDQVCYNKCGYDQCGVCGGDDDCSCPEYPEGTIKDCLGVCEGNAQVDCAGICDGDTIPGCDNECGSGLVDDCRGECGGSVQLDCAGVCDGAAYNQTHWGEDECTEDNGYFECVSGSTDCAGLPCEPCVQDCGEKWGGSINANIECECEETVCHPTFCYETCSSMSTDYNLVPKIFSISRIYPNPFNPQATIEYTISQADDIELSIYNIMGQQIDIVSDGYKMPGTYTKIWNGSSYPSGIYFVLLRSHSAILKQKIILLK